MIRKCNMSVASAWAGLVVFGASVAFAHLGDPEDTQPALIPCTAHCGGHATGCGANATASCCRQGTGAFSCTCCNANFDCLNPPSGWSCNDTH